MARSLIFSPIPQLPDDWWDGAPKDDPSCVWTVWDEDTYYLWGANSGNYEQAAIGESLSGGGMAGAHGPSRGRQHPHYIGMITMDQSQNHLNDPVFDALSDLVAKGKNVVVPTFLDEAIDDKNYKFSLGTGIGSGIPHWLEIQIYLLTKIHELGTSCDQVVFTEPTYWPNLSESPPTLHSFSDLGELEKLITALSTSV